MYTGALSHFLQLHTNLQSLKKRREKKMITRQERRCGGVGRESGERESCPGPHREMCFDSVTVEEL